MTKQSENDAIDNAGSNSVDSSGNGDIIRQTTSESESITMDSASPSLANNGGHGHGNSQQNHNGSGKDWNHASDSTLIVGQKLVRPSNLVRSDSETDGELDLDTDIDTLMDAHLDAGASLVSNETTLGQLETSPQASPDRPSRKPSSASFAPHPPSSSSALSVSSPVMSASKSRSKRPTFSRESSRMSAASSLNNWITSSAAKQQEHVPSAFIPHVQRGASSRTIGTSYSFNTFQTGSTAGTGKPTTPTSDAGTEPHQQQQPVVAAHVPLKLSAVPLRGRDKELKHLQSIYDSSIKLKNGTIAMANIETEPFAKSAICWLGGDSGAGKHAIVQEFITRVKQNGGDAADSNSAGSRVPIILSAKCSSKMNDKYADLAQLFSHFLRTYSTTSTFKRFRSKLNDEFKDGDYNVLSSLLPDLNPVRLNPSTMRSPTNGADGPPPSRFGAMNKTSSLSSLGMHRMGSARSIGNMSSRSLNSTTSDGVSANGNSIHTHTDRSKAVNRVKSIMKTFCTLLVSTFQRPIIMYLDDMQWADPASLDVVTFLWSNKSMQHFMGIGCYRLDEISMPSPTGQQHPLITKCWRVIEQNRPVATIHQMEVLNLKRQPYYQLITHLLDGKAPPSPRSSTNETSKQKEYYGSICRFLYDQTKGNMFFTQQMLDELQRKNLLYRQPDGKWKWDLASMIPQTGAAGVSPGQVSRTVQESLLSKIFALPRKLQHILKIMAYTRSTMDIDTMLALVRLAKRVEDEKQDAGVSAHSDVDVDVKLSHAELEELLAEDPHSERLLLEVLDTAVLEGLLINHMGSKRYSFAHTTIQEAACQLISPGQPREAYRLSLAKQMHVLAQYSQEDWMLYVAADLFNSTSEYQVQRHKHMSKQISKQKNNKTTLSHGQRDLYVHLATVNVEAGAKAEVVGAYEQAAKYLKIASLNVDRVGGADDIWKNHYDLALRLNRCKADVELMLGHFDTGRLHGQQVIDHATTLEEQMPTYISLALALSRQEQHARAMALCQTALFVLGAYPKRFYVWCIVRDLMAVRGFMRRNSNDDIVKLPSADPALGLETKLTFLGLLATQAFYCDNIIQFLVAAMTAMRLTMKHGLCNHSSQCFTMYAMILSKQNDRKGAMRCQALALKVLEATNGTHLKSNTLFVNSHWIDSWSASHEETLRMYREGHKSGMEMGDFENAFLNSFGINHHAHASGYPLADVERTGADLMEQLELYSIKSIAVMMKQARVPVRYLIRPNKSINWDRLEEFGSDGPVIKSSENYRLLFGYLGRLELGVIFGNYEFAYDMSQKLKLILPKDDAYVVLSMRLMYSSIAASGMTRRTGSMKYVRQARRLARRMKTMVGSRGTNSLHRYFIMLADIKAASKKADAAVEQAFRKAIEYSLEVDHTHDAALAHELAADYYRSRITHMQVKKRRPTSGQKGANAVIAKIEKNISHHLTQARDLYSQWGAEAKVRQIESMHKKFLKKMLATQTDSTGADPTDDISFFSHHNPSSRDLDLISTVSKPITKGMQLPAAQQLATADEEEGIEVVNFDRE